MITAIYPNLPVADIERARTFFTRLGFTFNEAFCDEKALAIEIGESANIMLLQKDFFHTFCKEKTVADPNQAISALLAVQVENREQVDAMLESAIEAGGKIHREPDDYGFMFSRSFTDLDGHIWEVFHLQP
jgi:predicted lactoylglutathione lyase